MIINQRNIDKKSNFNNIIIVEYYNNKKTSSNLRLSTVNCIIFFFFPVGHKAIYIISRVEMVSAKGEEAA